MSTVFVSPMTWQEKIVARRAELKMSQSDLGKAVGLHQSRIARWEGGDGMPSMIQGRDICRALQISYDYLVDDSLTEPPLPALSGGEMFLVDVIRGLGISRDDALKRLATPLIVTGPVIPGPAFDVPFSDKTKGQNRREK
jgi:transcriptional regulator with XRE-family HTH domain